VGPQAPEADRVPSSSPALCGDEAELFAAHHAALRARVCRHVRTSASNVDDACSFAWVQLLRRQPDRATVLEWLTTVAIREAIRLDQHSRRYDGLEGVADRASAHGTLTRAEALAALEVVATLPPRQRDVLALQVAGYSYDEIAQLTGRTARAVDRHLRRAHAAVRRARDE
jgi:RNA polymerase sigma-70 factor, ECF subfamily